MVTPTEQEIDEQVEVMNRMAQEVKTDPALARRLLDGVKRRPLTDEQHRDGTSSNGSTPKPATNG